MDFRGIHTFRSLHYANSVEWVPKNLWTLPGHPQKALFRCPGTFPLFPTHGRVKSDSRGDSLLRLESQPEWKACKHGISALLHCGPTRTEARIAPQTWTGYRSCILPWWKLFNLECCKKPYQGRDGKVVFMKCLKYEAGRGPRNLGRNQVDSTCL